MLQQLQDVNTSLRRIVFTVNDEQEAGLPAHAVDAITKLGGELVALKNSMPLPPSFGEILDSEARRVQYRKLALWSHTEFAKIIALDADVFVARRIDEMATFPADTFSPNLCSYGCDRRVAGFNSGVMVLAPSAERSAALARYAGSAASMAATDEARARDIAAADGVTLRSPFLPSVKTRIRAARQRGRRIPPPLGLHFAARRRRPVLLGRVVCRRPAGRGRGRFGRSHRPRLDLAIRPRRVALQANAAEGGRRQLRRYAQHHEPALQ